MGFWVPEANFYIQPSFLVSCQIIAWTSSQLCPGHSKADTAKNRIWGWGRDKISEGHSEVYITYILCCCVQSWGYALPTVVCAHTSFQSAREADWNSLTSERVYLALRAYRSTSNNKARSRTGRELKTGLRKGRSKWMAPDLSGQPVQPCLDSQHKASVLKDFRNAKVSNKATFIRQQGKPWTKWLEAC